MRYGKWYDRFFSNFGYSSAQVLLTKYVSLGSILVVLELFVGVVLYGVLGKWKLSAVHLTEMYVIAFFLASMAIFRHRENIKRLLNGTERKIGERAK